MDGEARLRLHRPSREEIVFQAEGRLENGCSGVYSVLVEDEGQYRLYYRGRYPLDSGGSDEAEIQTANVAISNDGIHFERPELGIVDLGDSGKNNVV